MMIAALLKSGRFSKGYVSDEQLHSLRELYRHKESLSNQIKALKRQTQTILTVVFPELETVIRDPFSVTGLALLEKYPTAKHYEYASVDRILKTFRGIQGNNFTRQKAQLLLDTARDSIYSGVAKEARALHIRMNIKQIRMLQEMLDETLKAMKQLLVGYLGLYPTLDESGERSRSGKLAKRGAKLAKKAIFLAAISAIKHNEQMYTIYLKYRSRGKAKKEALIIVARKLLAIIYAIYTRNEPYDPVRVFTAKPNA